ncbi:MAG: hypothetical protein ACOZDY_03120 [Pseudomonadota bacterium]
MVRLIRKLLILLLLLALPPQGYAVESMPLCRHDGAAATATADAGGYQNCHRESVPFSPGSLCDDCGPCQLCGAFVTLVTFDVTPVPDPALRFPLAAMPDVEFVPEQSLRPPII